jgi:uncharacterized membrane protein
MSTRIATCASTGEASESDATRTNTNASSRRVVTIHARIEPIGRLRPVSSDSWAELDRPERTPLLLGIVAGLLAAATLVAMVALWPHGDVIPEVPALGGVRDVFEARVTSVTEEPCPGSTTLRCRDVRVQLLEGPDEGSTTSLSFPVGETSIVLADGETVLLGYQPDADPQFRYFYVDRQRRSLLLGLAALFALAVVVLGRLRGVAALSGLAASFVVLFTFVLPAVLAGHSPLLVAMVGASAISFLALYLAHGFTLMTTVALLGTLASLAITVGLATVFTRLASFTGLTTEEAFIVQLGATALDLRGLVLGGVVIGALGAIDDMTVTQASAVWELKASNPRLRSGELFHSGLRIGRAHVASTVNTLFLAYAGASMPLLLLFLILEQPLGVVASREVIATEIIRTLVGSIGLVASVPLTTWLASRLASGSRERKAAGSVPSRWSLSRRPGRHRPRR